MTKDLFEQNYEKKGKGIKKNLERWKHLKISLMGRRAIIKMMVLPIFVILFQNILIIINNKPFHLWRKQLSNFIWQGRKPRIKLKYLQDDKNRGG